MEVDFHKPEPVVRRPKKVEETPVAAAEVNAVVQEPVKQEPVQPAAPVAEKAVETVAAPVVSEAPVEKKAVEEPVKAEEKTAPVQTPVQPAEKPVEEPAQKEATAEAPVQTRQDRPEQADRARQQSGQRWTAALHIPISWSIRRTGKLFSGRSPWTRNCRCTVRELYEKKNELCHAGDPADDIDPDRLHSGEHEIE
jgi:hypothetical protein